MVVLAGLGSMPGTLAAGLILGVAESLVLTSLGASWAPAVAFGMLLLVLAVRPPDCSGAEAHMHKWTDSRRRGRAVLVALLLTRVVDNEYLFFAGYVVLQFVVLATAWNILGGYAGYVNFGSGAFFAVGAYTCGRAHQGLRRAAARAGPRGCDGHRCLGFLVGALTLRLRGIFFSIATVAIAVICETVVINWGLRRRRAGHRDLAARPSRRFRLLQPHAVRGDDLLAVLAVALARYVEISWIGRGLRAIRDNEEAAESVGVPTLRLKLVAATLSGALMGVAGAPFPLYMSFIEPTSAFSLNYAVSALAMPIIGGTASWVGPVIGAVLLGTVQQVVTVTISSELNVLVVGARAGRLRGGCAARHPGLDPTAVAARRTNR